MDQSESELLESSLAAFRNAMHAERVELALHAPRRVLSALDGSDQEATVRGLAAAVGARAGAEVVERSGLADARGIAAAAAEVGADLVVVDAPFGEDYAASAGESLGSVVDVLLAECPLPLLVVRAPLESPGEVLRRVLVPFSRSDVRTAVAAGWAFGLVEPSGLVTLLDVVDIAVLEEAHRLLGAAVSLDPAPLVRAAERDAAALVGAAQRRGSEQGVDVHYEARAGHAVDVFLEALGAGPALAVMGFPRELDDPGRRRAHDLAQRGRGPVLLV